MATLVQGIRLVQFYVIFFYEIEQIKMFNCPSCLININVTNVADIRIHLNNHKRYCQLKFPIPCLQTENCKKTFVYIQGLIQHVRKYHPIDEGNDFVMDWQTHNMPVGSDSEDIQSQCDNTSGTENEIEPVDPIAQPEQPEEQEEGTQPSFEDVIDNFVKDFQSYLFEKLIELRAKGSVTLATSLHFVELLSFFIKKIYKNMLEAVGLLVTGDFNAPEVLEKLKTGFKKLKKATSSCDSEYKIRKQFHSHPLFVHPEEVVISQR